MDTSANSEVDEPAYEIVVDGEGPPMSGNHLLWAVGALAYQVLHAIRMSALTGSWRAAQPKRLRNWLIEASNHYHVAKCACPVPLAGGSAKEGGGTRGRSRGWCPSRDLAAQAAARMVSLNLGYSPERSA